jgi:AraC-like DNA-binding protein
LEHVHAELSPARIEDNSAAVGTVARRYGFINMSRFFIAFRRRFGETPSDIVRRASRS